ncbi:hypothetical protein [Embleya sp. NPDC005971]|uniref:hypothetical protein n=1 Tax=Embleya sp. NPDC005971 TaxID=3156724 RepID=UPI0034038CF8
MTVQGGFTPARGYGSALATGEPFDGASPTSRANTPVGARPTAGVGRAPGAAAVPRVEGLGRPARFAFAPGAHPGCRRPWGGLLDLLTASARERPLPCPVDDAHRPDHVSARVVAFAARRLREESVPVVPASRRSITGLCGLPESTVQGLGTAAAPDPRDRHENDGAAAATVRPRRGSSSVW